MSSFFKSTFFNDREKVIKQSLLAHLQSNAKEIQYEQLVQDESMRGAFSGSSDLELHNSLAITIEAIFLHGLKNSFLSRAANALVASEDEKPEPNFWPPLLIITHKNTIEQIQSFTQLHGDIGFCRAWIRQSLNDLLLSSYLKTIRSNRSALDPYYNKHAFIRDSEYLEISEKVIADIEGCSNFSLPCNAGILNQWPNLPLEMAGLWSPPLRSLPVAQGFDISQAMPRANPMQIPKPASYDDCAASITNSPFMSRLSEVAMAIEVEPDVDDEDDDKVIVTRVEIVEKPVPEQPKPVEVEPPRSPLDEKSELTTIDELREQLFDNKSMTSSCDHLSFTTDSDLLRERKRSVPESMTNSYSCLFATLQQQKQNFHRNTPDIYQILKNFESSVTITTEKDTEADTPEQTDISDDFVVLPTTMKFTKDQLHGYIETLCMLANESGLKEQNFSCKGCNSPLGVGLDNAQVCAFDGFYYCNACMSTEQVMIPSKIVYNWDFRRYPVSKQAATFLIDYAGLPLIHFRILNPDIYSAILEMYNLQKLRIQFNFIRAYLFNCDSSQPTMDKLRRHLFSKSYLYETIHQYSIADFELIKIKSFEPLLTKNIQIGREHILKCPLCSQKGFLCEVCHNPEVLFPFDVDITYRCQKCTNVYHKTCMNENIDCPKCTRIQKRLELSLQEEEEN